MFAKPRTAWALLIAANVMVWGVLSFLQTGSAAPRGAKEPFANAVTQRAEIAAHLQEIAGLLKEQNALLKSGKLKVIVTP